MFADSMKTDVLGEKTAMLENLLGLGEKKHTSDVGTLLGEMAVSLGALGEVTARLSQIFGQRYLMAGLQNGFTGTAPVPGTALYGRLAQGILTERPTLGSTALLSAAYRPEERDSFSAVGKESTVFHNGTAESPYRNTRLLRQQSEKLLRV